MGQTQANRIFQPLSQFAFCCLMLILSTGCDNSDATDTDADTDTNTESAPDAGTDADALPADLTIMPLGDSITFGYGAEATNAGYRGPLYELLNPVLPDFLFVGSSTENSSVTTLPKEQWHNEGHGSYAIYDIDVNLDGFDDTLYQKWGEENRNPNGGHWLDGIESGDDARPALFPDVILMLVGANDRDNLDGAEERLDGLVEKIVTMRPDAKLVMARVSPITDSETHIEFVDSFNQMVDAVFEKYAADNNVYLADMFTDFPSDGLGADGLHPNDTGYTWIAERWYEAIMDIFGVFATK